MIAAMASGALMWGVHFLAKKIPASEYGTFITLFSVVSLIPTIPLQMVFTQQTAAGLAKNQERQLTSMIRASWLGIFLFWLAARARRVYFPQPDRRQLASGESAGVVDDDGGDFVFAVDADVSGRDAGPAEFSLAGLEQHFHGVFRLSAAVFIVFALNGQAAGIMTGVFLGFLAATIVGIWQTRALWLRKRRAVRPARFFARGGSAAAGFCGDAISFLRGHDFC